MNTHKKARTMLIISALMFGTIGLFTRNIQVTSSELALYRAILATLVLSTYFLLTKKKIDLVSIKKDFPYLLCSGGSMGLNWILLFEAFRYTTISAATISYYFAPVIVTIACVFLFDEHLTKKKILCFSMSTLGLLLTIGITNLQSGSNDLKGITFGLGAAVFYACVILLNKGIKHVSGLERTLLQFLGAIIVITPYVLCTTGFNLTNLTTSGWFCLLFVGFIHTGVTYCLYFSALKDLPGQESAILSYLDPLMAVVLSVFVLGEKITSIQILGACLILGFTLWNELPSK